MAYRPDFYRKDNIIGYTGRITSNPTVYFQYRHDEFGRITQDHPRRNNIGRDKVRKAMDYRIANTGPGNVSQEFYHGRVHHTSRNPFKPANWVEKILLARAIYRFQDIKPKYRNSP
jgi:hypothetical protein